MAVGERPRPALTVRSAAPHSCSPAVRLEVLGRVPYFSDLDPEELRRIEPLIPSQGYHPGSTIYRADDEATKLFIVASGNVKLLRPSVRGQDVVTNILGPGEGFGTLGLLGGTTYPDNAETMTASCILEVSTELFKAVMERHPRLARAVLDEALHRLEQAQQNIRRLSVDSARQRVAAALLALADKFGTTRGRTITLELPLTRADLSELTGLTPETVSRVVSRLSDDGIVGTGRRWVAVLDRDRLVAEVEE